MKKSDPKKLSVRLKGDPVAVLMCFDLVNDGTQVVQFLKIITDIAFKKGYYLAGVEDKSLGYFEGRPINNSLCNKAQLIFSKIKK